MQALALQQANLGINSRDSTFAGVDKAVAIGCFPKWDSFFVPQGRKAVAVLCSGQDESRLTENRTEPLPPLDLHTALQPAEAYRQSATDGIAAGTFGVPDKLSRGRTEEKLEEKVVKFLQAATKALEERNYGQVALYGGITAAGLLFAQSVVSSFDGFPLLPEAMQTVGVAYSILFASWMLKGKPVHSVPISPFKAVIELVDSGKYKAERTNLLLAQDQDGEVVAAMERLAKDRDALVNQVEAMQKTITQHAQILAEKEALEAVAIQLVAERDEGVSEASELKQAVDAMTDKMHAVESMLKQEVQQLNQHNVALETVALQMAAERDRAVKEVEELRKHVGLETRSMEEKHAFEVVASQLAQEKDAASLEIEELKKVVAVLQAAGSTLSGLTPEQETFIKARIHALRSQFIDVTMSYEDQEGKVDSFVSHLVEEYGAPREWTLDCLKQILNPLATENMDCGLDSGVNESERTQTILTT